MGIVRRHTKRREGGNRGTNSFDRHHEAANGRPTAFDWSLPGGQDHYFKAISELAADGCLTGEKVMEINKKFSTNFPAAH
jgi:hypothetical protein